MSAHKSPERAWLGARPRSYGRSGTILVNRSFVRRNLRSGGTRNWPVPSRPICNVVNVIRSPTRVRDPSRTVIEKDSRQIVAVIAVHELSSTVCAIPRLPSAWLFHVVTRPGRYLPVETGVAQITLDGVGDGRPVGSGSIRRAPTGRDLVIVVRSNDDV